MTDFLSARTTTSSSTGSSQVCSSPPLTKESSACFYLYNQQSQYVFFLSVQYVPIIEKSLVTISSSNGKNDVIQK